MIIAGALICNIADSLQYMTGGYLKSTLHRVMRPVGMNQEPIEDVDRYNRTLYLPVSSPYGVHSPTVYVNGSIILVTTVRSCASRSSSIAPRAKKTNRRRCSYGC